MRRERFGRRGFGLIESLLALFLFALILVVLTELVTGYRTLIAQSQGRSRTLKGAQFALAQIRSDLQSATSVLAPLLGTSVELELERIRPGSARLPDPLPAAAPAIWNVLDPSSLYGVRYRLDGDRLLRASGGQDFVLASGLASFTVTVLNPQYQIELKINERSRTATLVTRVSRL